MKEKLACPPTELDAAPHTARSGYIKYNHNRNIERTMRCPAKRRASGALQNFRSI
ncbi:hypothetical protein [Bradyrhizobium sp. AS23.2]|uniref:hypothetical protein n=1 Tax=Bradyrhizobium sp. AS23.2 TaxID=1680155 RepID=UPI00143098D1|nr:hypothetical protein [Bradyrhizobium sp. AS23.2]